MAGNFKTTASSNPTSIHQVIAIIPRFCRFCSCLEDGIFSRMSPTGVILTVLFSKIPRFVNRGILENSTVKITPVGDILEKMPSSRQEQNRQNRGIMIMINLQGSPSHDTGLCDVHASLNFVYAPASMCTAGEWDHVVKTNKLGRSKLLPAAPNNTCM